MNFERKKSRRILTATRAEEGYVLAAAAMFAAIGLVMLFIALDDVPPLRKPDALLGLPTRTVVVFAGLLHLAISGYLFASEGVMNQGFVVLWTGLNHVVYALGMSWLKAAVPFPAVELMAWKLGISSKMADICWKASIAYLLLGSLLILMIEWRRLKRLGVEMFLQRWGEVRERRPSAERPAAHGIRSAGAEADACSRYAREGEMSDKPLVNEVKFSCPSCGQHVRCDAGYSGRHINCPACQRQMVVPRANGT